VESFERKLEEAQKALNIDPRDYVPVLYIDETDHARELLRILPAMALLGRCLMLTLMLMLMLYIALIFNHYAH
jgi:AFG3 family protein